MDFYERRFNFKLIILAASLFIGGASLYYTNSLVSILADREHKLIELNANALKALANSEEGDNLNFVLYDVIAANNSVPMVLTDINKHYQSHRNFEIQAKPNTPEFDTLVAREIRVMEEQYPPIVVEAAGIRQYIFYRNSALITQLKYFPLVQLLVIGVFGLISYMAFSNSRRAEQNRVWVGLAKETAHQLGTPLSALMGWVDYLKSEGTLDGTGIVDELNKDVKRLEMITQRFSSIGSKPNLQLTELEPVVQSLLEYLRPRVSSRVELKVEALSPGLQAYINVPLFEWVVENVCKNAVDAMDAKGTITVRLARSAKGKAIVDITDTGKGIPKNQFSKVFEPGFTTKKRGWGLGLTLVKRIVDNYHHGKIFVYRSELGKGTTFRILLNRDGE